MSRKANMCHHNLLLSQPPCGSIHSPAFTSSVSLHSADVRLLSVWEGFIVAAHEMWHAESRVLVWWEKILAAQNEHTHTHTHTHTRSTAWDDTCPVLVSLFKLKQEHIFQKLKMWRCAVNGSFINLLFTLTVGEMRGGGGHMMSGGVDMVEWIISLQTAINLLFTLNLRWPLSMLLCYVTKFIHLKYKYHC